MRRGGGHPQSNLENRDRGWRDLQMVRFEQVRYWPEVDIGRALRQWF